MVCNGPEGPYPAMLVYNTGTNQVHWVRRLMPFAESTRSSSRVSRSASRWPGLASPEPPHRRVSACRPLDSAGRPGRSREADPPAGTRRIQPALIATLLRVGCPLKEAVGGDDEQPGKPRPDPAHAPPHLRPARGQARPIEKNLKTGRTKRRVVRICCGRRGVDRDCPSPCVDLPTSWVGPFGPRWDWRFEVGPVGQPRGGVSSGHGDRRRWNPASVGLTRSQGQGSDPRWPMCRQEPVAQTSITTTAQRPSQGGRALLSLAGRNPSRT